MMLDRMLDNISNSLAKISPEYLISIENRLKMFLEYTQLPPCYMQSYIDVANSPIKVKMLINGSTEMISFNASTLVNLETFKDGGFISSICIENYAVNCILQDTHIPSILYIDTKMLIEDYKRLMDKNIDGISPTTTHSLEILYKEIEEAEYVFWDKFSMVESTYGLSKLYDILNVRYRECLGNMFFITGGYDKFKAKVDIELLNVMNFSGRPVYDLSKPRIDSNGKVIGSNDIKIKYVSEVS